MLADFIIEKSHINNTFSTSYQEHLFDIANQEDRKYIENILINLGKLDWRKESETFIKSSSLNRIWNKIISCDNNYNPYIKSVIKASYYQPEYALNFVKKNLYANQNLGDLPEILRYVAYNSEHLVDACKLLWKLRKYNTSINQIEIYLGNSPGKIAIQTLFELCEVRPSKSMYYSEKVVEFGLYLLKKESSWLYTYTPFDILMPILKTEGEFTEFTSHNVNFAKFTISPHLVLNLRNKVIDAAIELLSHSNLKSAILAAKFLEKAIRYSVSRNDFIMWEKEFITVLEKIERKINSTSLDFLVLVQIARSIIWHAN